MRQIQLGYKNMYPGIEVHYYPQLYLDASHCVDIP